MTEIQKQIKLTLESSFEQSTNEKIIVEYVANVVDRANEIQTLIKTNMHNVYEAIHYTGMFLPATDHSCAYILIQEDRNDNLDIMTAFHEMQHAIEYTLFLNGIFTNNRQQMVNSKLYTTFQIYSEFSAMRVGVSNYLTYVQHSEMSPKEFATCLLDTYHRDYIDFNGIINRYQFIIHTIQYLGVLFGLKDVIKEFDLDSEINKLIYLDELEEILDLLTNFAFNYSWFETFDRATREFIM